MELERLNKRINRKGKMKYKAYPEYKNSGVKWIGKIPLNWKINKFKHFFVSNMGQTILTPDIDTKGKYPVLSATEEDIIFGFINNPNFVLEEGDFVIPARGNSIGFVKLVSSKCVATQTTIYARKINRSSNSKYYYYFLRYHKENLFPFTNTAIPQITVFEVKENPLVVPTEEEQITIVRYLDKKIAEIDTLIKKDKKLIELLQEKRTALINHLVTKGLNPNARMKNSGVKWIGKIPKDWELVKIKHLAGSCSMPVQTGPFGAQLHAEDYVNDGIPLVLIRNVIQGKIILENIPFVSVQDAERLSMYKIKTNDIVISRVGSLGRSAIVTDNEDGWLISGQMLRVRLKDNRLLPSFLFNIFQSKLSKTYLIYESVGSTRKSLNTSILSNMVFPLPCVKEQQKIVNYLDKQTSNIDKTIQKIQQKINLLEEYKKSLIHHVVTGKVDVRGVEI